MIQTNKSTNLNNVTYLTSRARGSKVIIMIWLLSTVESYQDGIANEVPEMVIAFTCTDR